MKKLFSLALVAVIAFVAGCKPAEEKPVDAAAAAAGAVTNK